MAMKYRVTPLKETEVECAWLTPERKDYKTLLHLLKTKMGPKYAEMSELISRILNHISEDKKISRIMPKNEWVFAVHIQIATDSLRQNYLLILGADVSTKAKSMGYGAGRDDKAFDNAYFVLGSKEVLQEVKFGKSTKTRKAKDVDFYEYDVSSPAILELLFKLLKIVMLTEGLP